MRVLRNSQSIVDRRGEILGTPWITRGMTTELVGRAEDGASGDAASGEPDALHRTPVIAAGQGNTPQGRDLRGSAEFPCHDHEGVVEDPALLQIIEQGGDGAVGGREKVVAQIREDRLVIVPGLVVAEIHLHEAHARFDELARHQERPAEGVAAIAVLRRGIGAVDVEGGLDLGIGEQAHGHVAVAVDTTGGGGGLEMALLFVEESAEGEAILETLEVDRVRQLQAEGAVG